MPRQPAPYYPQFERLLAFRTPFILVILALLAGLFLTIDRGYILNDQALWLEGSREYQRVLHEKYPKAHVYRVQAVLPPGGADREEVALLGRFHRQLEKRAGVYKVESAFSGTQAVLHKEDGSSLLEMRRLETLDPEELLELMEREPERFAGFVSPDRERFSFFVVGDAAPDLEELELPYDYLVSGEEEPHRVLNDRLLFGGLALILFLLFTLAFSSLLPSLAAILFIAANTAATLGVYGLFFPGRPSHVSVVLIAVTVSLMDFIYIYYKWHVLQAQLSAHKALYRALAMTFQPIFWTTFVTVIGIGSLLLTDSFLLQSIGYNVVISALSGFVLSFTLLPAALSFFRVKRPKVLAQLSVRHFADLEAHYHKKTLNFFLGATLAAALAVAAYFVAHPVPVQADRNGCVVDLSLKSRSVDNRALEQIAVLEEAVENEFGGMVKVRSVLETVRQVVEAENPARPFAPESVDLDGVAFSLELYGLGEMLEEGDPVRVTLFLEEPERKSEVIRWLRKWDREKNLLFADHHSLLSAAKTDSIFQMMEAVALVLILLMAVSYFMTRHARFSVIALMVNAIPIVWLMAAVVLFRIPLSTEMVVGMIIAVALSSDATMHFFHYFYNHRHDRKDNEKILENAMFYVGTPLAMGNVILALSFAVLLFVQIPAIHSLGLYSTLLVGLSLLVDLLVLPVLYLRMIKEDPNIRDFYHAPGDLREKH